VKNASLQMQKSVAKTVTADARIGSENCVAADQEIGSKN
jgi:hypothetical protein